MGLDLKGKQVEALRDALCSAFPSWSDLDAMVEIEIGEHLEGFVQPGPMERVAFDLVRWARSRSRLDDLLAGALRKNPRNAELRRLSLELSLSSDAPPSASLEALVMRTVPFANAAQWRERMASAERCICRIEHRDSNGAWRGIGTGSLVAPDVILTNAHVAALLTSTDASRAQFDFSHDAKGEERQGRLSHFANQPLAHSPLEDLDYALLRLAEQAGNDLVDGGKPRGWITPQRHQFTAGEPLLILQHPTADRLKLAVGAVSDVQIQPPRIRYSTNTLPGSSGSPCFTMAWDFVGLHQAGEASVNRGIPAGAILERLESSSALGLIGAFASHESAEGGSISAMAPALPQPRRIFMSYHRRGEEAQLAGRLRDALSSMGHSVFIDVEMSIGTDWANEIQRHIVESDVFIVLLSEESIAREMVQREVREAYRRQRTAGRPQILPVRVRYDGPLDYEIECYLGRLHYLQWNTPSDNATVIDHITRAITGISQTPPGSPSARATAASTPLDGRPAPAMDPRFLATPGGTMVLRDPMYIRRQGDDDVEALARSEGETLIIKGARQRGKSSLLVRYLAACRDRRKHIALIDFQTLSGVELETYPEFLGSVAVAIMDALGISAPEPMIRRQIDMTRFLQRTVLAATTEPLVLAFDEVDRIAARTYKTDFFAMLRSWHNSRATAAAWQTLDLALVLSTEPTLLIQDEYQSPFNVGHTIELDCLTENQCHEMNQRCGPRQLGADDVDELYDWLGGHPYLTRLAYHRVLTGMLRLPIEPRTACDPHGPFGDHLRAMLSRLTANPELLTAIQQIIRVQRAKPELVHRLRSVGLVRTDGGAPSPTNLLYTNFFRAIR